MPDQICPIAAPTPTGRIAQCALGCGEPAPRTEIPEGTGVLWYTVDAEMNLGQRRGRVCTQATSMMPSPDRKGTYLIQDGDLYVIRPGAKQPAPIEIEGRQPGWRFSRLLGFRRWNQGMPILLAEMTRDDGDRYQLWSVRLLGRGGIGAPVRDEEMPRNPQSFFADFQTPRCQTGHQRCLVVSPPGEGSAGLGIEARRGQDVVTKPLPKPDWTLLDASWVPGRPGEVVLLVGGSCKPRR